MSVSCLDLMLVFLLDLCRLLFANCGSSATLVENAKKHGFWCVCARDRTSCAGPRCPVHDMLRSLPRIFETMSCPRGSDPGGISWRGRRTVYTAISYDGSPRARDNIHILLDFAGRSRRRQTEGVIVVRNSFLFPGRTAMKRPLYRRRYAICSPAIAAQM